MAREGGAGSLYVFDWRDERRWAVKQQGMTKQRQGSEADRGGGGGEGGV
jgi:hypothetical protein